MILDNETQRQMLIDLINQSTFSGQSIEDVFKLKLAIKESKIKED